MSLELRSGVYAIFSNLINDLFAKKMVMVLILLARSIWAPIMVKLRLFG